MITLLSRFAVFYMLVLVALYLAQRHLQYFPDTKPPGTPEANRLPDMRVVTAKTEDGLSLLAWFAPPRKKDGKIIVMYHGNAGTIANRAVKARYFLEQGYGIYMCEYRGYGGNAGSPSEDGLYKDGRSALKWLEGEGYSPAQFILYGESLGTGVAVQMALEIQPKQMILEAPFSSAVAVAQKQYFFVPVSLLMKDKYDSVEKIGQIRSSILIVHGDEDETIPLSLAQDLYKAANHPKKFITINGGGHTDLYDHHAGHIILDWLDHG